MDKESLNMLNQIKEQLLNEIKGINQRLDGIDNRLDGMDFRLDEMDQRIEDIRKEILDQHFLFEHEYGMKIRAIFDSVTLELDKNIEKSEKIRKLDGRMDRNEVTIFNHEKRISKLELNL